MTNAVEPEALIVRRVAPFGPPAIALALLIGGLAADWNTGWSAALGISVVWINVIVSGVSLTYAAKVSLLVLYAVAMGGFVLRMALILGLMAGLDQLAFFSPLVFALATVPATVLLLAFEIKLVAGGLGRELEVPAPQATSGKGAR